MAEHSYVVRIENLGEFISKTKSLAEDISGRVRSIRPEFAPRPATIGRLIEKLNSPKYERIKWFYYCDRQYGNTIRLYDSEFHKECRSLYIEPNDYVILRGKHLGLPDTWLKHAIRDILEPLETPSRCVNTNKDNLSECLSYFEDEDRNNGRSRDSEVCEESQSTDAEHIGTNSAHIHYSHGWKLREQGQFQEAIDSFNRAIRIKPDYAMAYVGLGILLKDSERWTEAKEAYEKALSIKPENLSAHHNLGGLYMNLKQWHDAIDALKKAIKINPEFPMSHAWLAEAYEQAGDRESALKECEVLLKLDVELACWVSDKITAKGRQISTLRYIIGFELQRVINHPKWTDVLDALLKAWRNDEAVVRLAKADSAIRTDGRFLEYVDFDAQKRYYCPRGSVSLWHTGGAFLSYLWNTSQWRTKYDWLPGDMHMTLTCLFPPASETTVDNPTKEEIMRALKRVRKIHESYVKLSRDDITFIDTDGSSLWLCDHGSLLRNVGSTEVEKNPQYRQYYCYFSSLRQSIRLFWTFAQGERWPVNSPWLPGSLSESHSTIYDYWSAPNRNVYHTKTCHWAMYLSNAVGYVTREEAERNGKRPCKRCCW